MKLLGFSVIVISCCLMLSAAKQNTAIEFSSTTTAKRIIADGSELFTKYCSDCHAIEEEIYGPALRDIEKRREKEWIISFVLDQKELMKTDEVAAAMYQSSEELHMSFSSMLTAEDIKQILVFIEEESKK